MSLLLLILFWPYLFYLIEPLFTLAGARLQRVPSTLFCLPLSTFLLETCRLHKSALRLWVIAYNSIDKLRKNVNAITSIKRQLNSHLAVQIYNLPDC
jgi:hypothetical protein